MSLPNWLQSAVYDALNEGDIERKQTLVRGIDERMGTTVFDPKAWCRAKATPIPGRPLRPQLVPPRQLPRRRLASVQGRASLIHAIAHIEFNAINLALDAVYRFAAMPKQYYLDWISVAVDEARHFSMLAKRLQSLDYQYGDFPAHNGLWEMAVATADDCMTRMALVPRVLEARGLDVTPGMIERLTQAGDDATVAVLETILREEVRHVEIGTRWFHYCCEQAQCEPEQTFFQLMKQHSGVKPKRPFNHSARLEAGFSLSEMQTLEALAEPCS